MNPQLIARYIDHTLLKPTATMLQIKQLCAEAAMNRFVAVCVPPSYVELAKNEVEKSGIKVATVVGFPFGYNHSESKAIETELAIGNGADEIDMVMNIGDVLNDNIEYLYNEISYITGICHERGAMIKLIIESGILTKQQIITACGVCADAGVDFVKTSTGYAEHGASIASIELMRQHLPASVQIKASGGIKTYEQALAFIKAGATRIGTSSGIEIIQGQKTKSID
jgi:deoxyribose-phosphate aldolase